MRDYEFIQNAIRQRELAEQAEQMKKKAMRDIVSYDINQSRALRQVKDEN